MLIARIGLAIVGVTLGIVSLTSTPAIAEAPIKESTVIVSVEGSAGLLP